MVQTIDADKVNLDAGPHSPAPPEDQFALFGVTKSTVSDRKDGHPSGRHMIDAFRLLAGAQKGRWAKETRDIYRLAALCIENEAKRADRAEALLAGRSEATITNASQASGMKNNDR